MGEFGKSPFLQWVSHKVLKASGSARLFYWVVILSTANNDNIYQQKYLSHSLWPTVTYFQQHTTGRQHRVSTVYDALAEAYYANQIYSNIN
jgi:hypothetical protein